MEWFFKRSSVLVFVLRSDRSIVRVQRWASYAVTELLEPPALTVTVSWVVVLKGERERRGVYLLSYRGQEGRGPRSVPQLLVGYPALEHRISLCRSL